MCFYAKYKNTDFTAGKAPCQKLIVILLTKVWKYKSTEFATLENDVVVYWSVCIWYNFKGTKIPTLQKWKIWYWYD